MDHWCKHSRYLHVEEPSQISGICGLQYGRWLDTLEFAAEERQSGRPGSGENREMVPMGPSRVFVPV